MKLILLGAPGAGKGTQADIISQRYDIPQISTGAILREAIANETKLGVKVKAIIEAGQLVPDEDVVGIVKERLLQPDCIKGFILDGFPRTIPQAESLDVILGEMGIAIDKVISIEVKDEDIVQRMSGRRVCKDCGATFHTMYNPSKKGDDCDKCGKKLIIRADDSPEVVRDRLGLYHKQTFPLKEYYAKSNKLFLVEGQEELSDTTALVQKALQGV